MQAAYSVKLKGGFKMKLMGKRWLQLPKLEELEQDFGKRLAKVRKIKGITQVELANKLGTTQGMVSSYEGGRLRLNAEMLVRFCLALEVSADEILGLQQSLSEFTPIDEPSLRIYKRLKKIEALSPTKQRAVLQTLDLVLQSVTNEAVP